MQRLKKFFSNTKDENKVLIGVIGLVLLIGLMVFTSIPARGADAAQCFPIQAQIDVANSAGNITTARMEGMELKAFESILKTVVPDFALEANTTAMYIFIIADAEAVLMEVNAEKCILSGGRMPAQLLKTLIAKMSATL